MARVAIIGAGVSGLSVGLYLSETHVTSDLTVFSDKFSPSTTSDRAGGLILPLDGPLNICGTANEPATDRWTAATYERMRELLHTGAGPQCGLKKIPVMVLNEDRPSLPRFAALHPEFRVLSPEQAGLSSRFNTVWQCECYCIDTTQYLCWLRSSFTERGGLMVQRKIGSLSELMGDYDVVINCTGLGARELVGDYSVYPVRGQIVEVKNAHVKGAYFNAKPYLTYVIPHDGRVFLGGSAEPNNWSMTVDPEQTELIYQRCVELCPQLRGSRVVRAWAGLRPARPTVRVEVDSEFGGESLLLHNYGHGGQGYILSCGCAADIAGMVETHLKHELKSYL